MFGHFGCALRGLVSSSSGVLGGWFELRGGRESTRFLTSLRVCLWFPRASSPGRARAPCLKEPVAAVRPGPI
eukprot:11206212-Lingulodinium_polyedra.AAC.1